MKIGYPGTNESVGCSSSRTFRLSSFTQERFLSTAKENLSCLEKILRFNQRHQLLFFRISSNLIPYASHSVNTVDWFRLLNKEFNSLSQTIHTNQMRITMHPGPFTVLNSPSEIYFQNSLKILFYHWQVFSLLKLSVSPKIVLHLGGVYGQKGFSLKRFISRFQTLPAKLQNIITLENDERYNIQDCFLVSQKTGLPITLDAFHHQLNNQGESILEAWQIAASSWQTQDGPPIVHFSQQEIGKAAGSHARHLNKRGFIDFFRLLGKFEFDLMMEFKDKEKSALAAQKIIQELT